MWAVEAEEEVDEWLSSLNAKQLANEQLQIKRARTALNASIRAEAAQP